MADEGFNDLYEFGARRSRGGYYARISRGIYSSAFLRSVLKCSAAFSFTSPLYEERKMSEKQKRKSVKKRKG